MRSSAISLLLLGILLQSAPLLAQEKFPGSTNDGLKLEEHNRNSAFYLKPGASLAAYDKVKILDCFVEFKKNWQRDYNRAQMGLDHRVTDTHVKLIKEAVAAEFSKAFTNELQSKGYEIVDTAGPDVLLLRPAVINLTLSAPDVRNAGSSRAFVQSNGTMTLYMEAYDSATSAKVAQFVDSELVGTAGVVRQGGAVRDRFEFDKTMVYWAKKLTKRLDEAHGK